MNDYNPIANADQALTTPFVSTPGVETYLHTRCRNVPAPRDLTRTPSIALINLMELSLLLARFWGITLIVTCTTLLFNRKLYGNLLRAVQKEELMSIVGIFTVMAGALHIAIFETWSADYKGLITILGWSIFIKGVLAFAFPQTFQKILKIKWTIFASPIGIIFLIIGFWLLNIGFKA